MIEFIQPRNLVYLHETFNILRPLSAYYPDFSDWYWDKVVPGILLGEDKLIIMKRNDVVAGVSILKDREEKKLRCLRMSPEFQQKGLGLYLIDESLKQLDTDKPLCSVSEEMMHEFSRIFINRYGFDLTHVYNNLYRKGKLEYEFNGERNLKQKSIYF